jgi:signal transduction histidine kinase
LLFIKLVPMIAALALEPNNDMPGRPRLLGILDLASLLVYWAYVFLFWAMAYRFAGNDLASYNRNSDIVDALGNLSFLVILAVVTIRSRGPWRSFYSHFFGASALYAVASILLNKAIGSGRYYTGSVYDVPLTAAMAWFCIISITTNVDSQSPLTLGSEQPEDQQRSIKRPALWVARLSMVATFATPAIGLWLVTSGDLQDSVRHFRVLLTLFTMLLVTLLLLVKQDLLNFKLAGKLRDASLAYRDLKKFQDQLVQNEKLASLGKLVAQVAHEINRAMIVVGKDIEALGPPSVDISRQKMTTKIQESALRTNNLVESMLSFAQELPLHRSHVSVRPLLERAVTLARAERRHNVQVEILENDVVPLVEGDANQLVQVFLHIIANAIDSMEGIGAGFLKIALRARKESVEIEFSDTGPGLKDPRRVFEPFYTTKPIGRGVGLGLSTCYGIIRQHGGVIECWNRPEGGAVFKLLVPATVVEVVEPVTQTS